MIDLTIRQKVIQAAKYAANRACLGDHEVVMATWISRLKAAAEQPDLSQRLKLAKTQRWAGAAPTWEPVTLHEATSSEPVDVIGIDGSQIFPKLTSPVLWTYIQAVAYRKLQKPQFVSRFYDIGSEIANGGHPSDELVENRDDLISLTNAWRTGLEMQLARMSAEDIHNGSDAAIFFDNGLLPWLSIAGASAETLVQEYLADFCSIRPVTVAGIVSGPQSRLLSRFIHLAEEESVVQGVKDKDSIADIAMMRYLLTEGERSALFIHSSPRNDPFTQLGTGVYFFFLHLSLDEIVRVEIPEWVARDTQAIDRLQASVIADAAPTGYSYVLSQAHHQAVINMDISHQLHTAAEICYFQETGYLAPLRAKTCMKQA